MSTPASTTVLVTGGSGFIASYVILALLSQGYRVRTTVRSLSRESKIKNTLTSGGVTADGLSRLSFAEASLESDDGWTNAMDGCEYVQHIASPNPPELPKSEDDLIIPARDGTVRILRAAATVGVKRVVVTSSLGAVAFGHSPRDKPFTEDDWTVINHNADVSPYTKSKTIAEKSAWDFINSDANQSKVELAVVCPALVIGPVLGKDVPTSVLVVKKLMDGSIPGCPKINFSLIDVRDIATLHVLAMTKSEAAGQRFLGSPNDEYKVTSMLQIGQLIRAIRPEKAKKVPNFEIPNFIVRGMSFFDKPIRLVVPDLGKTREGSSQKARTMLGWQSRATRESLSDTVDSLVKYMLV